MKRSELFFNVAALPLDFAMLLLAGVASFYIRLSAVNFVGPVLYDLSSTKFLLTAVSILPVVLVIFATLGLYHVSGTKNLWTQTGRIILGMSASLFLIVILFFFDQTIFPSRFIVLSSWVLGIIAVVLGRFMLRVVQRLALRNGYGLHRLLVINGQHTNSRVIMNALKNPNKGYLVTAELDFNDDIIRRLEETYAKEKFDEILQANPSLGDRDNLELLEFAKGKGLGFSYLPNSFDVQRNIIDMEEFAGLPVIAIKNSPLDGWGKVIKRLVDVTISLLAMIVLSPVYVLLYVLVKLDSPGPAIYAHIRGGSRKDFMFYKFRSMHTHLSNGLGGQEAERVREELWKKNDRGGQESPFLKIKNDPRVTRIGRIIRKTKVDELPQFYNVLKGDMSLVGPRAHMLEEVERYRNRYRRMFSIKPGIFGLSQLAQMSWPDLPFEEEIRLNTYYIENWSLWLDAKILWKCAWQIFFGKKPKEDY